MLNVVGYLKLKNNLILIFDPSYPNIDQSSFGNVIEHIFLRVQWKLFHAMCHHLEAKRGINVCLLIAIILTACRLEDLGLGYVTIELVFKEEVHHRDISVWCKVCNCESQNFLHCMPSDIS